MADESSGSTPDSGHRTGLPRWMFLGLGIVVVVVLGVRFVYSKVSDDGASDATVDHTPQQVEDSDPPRVTTTLAQPGAPVEPTCPAEDGSSEPTWLFTAAPPSCLADGASYVAHVETSRGDFDITLDPAEAPVNVNNFVFLARYHYYDGVGFHRVIPRFVAQAGDPVGNPVGDPDSDDYDAQVGTGSPGYTVTDEFPTQAPYYPLYSVAMANRFPETDSASSQFFVVTGEEGQSLAPNYSRIGEVTSGTDVIDAISGTGLTDGSGEVSELTVIEKVTIEQS
jgi:cyclophilin family peptidyl-prolyl cis-trans isomerase